MPWFSEIKAKSGLIPRKWKTWRPPAEVRHSQANGDHPVGFAFAASISQPLKAIAYLLSVAEGHKRFQGCPQTFWFFSNDDTILPRPFCLVESLVGPAE